MVNAWRRHRAPTPPVCGRCLLAPPPSAAARQPRDPRRESSGARRAVWPPRAAAVRLQALLAPDHDTERPRRLFADVACWRRRPQRRRGSRVIRDERSSGARRAVW